MKSFFYILAGLAALTTCSVNSSAKVFDNQHLPNLNQLRNADSFSVECKNNRTGIIDRETVDVDAATVTVEIPGMQPAVHHIISSSNAVRDTQDRFGQPGTELTVRLATWGQIGASAVGLLLSSGRWYSHHEDDSWWTCAI